MLYRLRDRCCGASAVAVSRAAAWQPRLATTLSRWCAISGDLLNESMSDC